MVFYPDSAETDVNTMEYRVYTVIFQPPQKGFRAESVNYGLLKSFFSLLSLRLFRCDKEDYTIYLESDLETFVQFV